MTIRQFVTLVTSLLNVQYNNNYAFFVGCNSSRKSLFQTLLMYLKLRLHLSTLIIRNICYFRNFPRPSNAFIYFQGLRRSSGIPGSPGLPGSCMRSASSKTTTPTIFCAPGKQGLKAIKGDNGSC